MSNSILIAESIIPTLINCSSPNRIVTSLANVGFVTVEDVETLKRESIEIALGSDNATADVRTRLLYVAKYLRRGGNLQNEDLTILDVVDFVREADERRNRLSSLSRSLFRIGIQVMIGDEPVFE